MKIKIPTQHISAIFLLIIFTSCMGILNKGHRSSEFLLLGSDINKVNESGGVVQASPGLENTPTTTNTTTSTENTSGVGTGETFVIPSDKSLLRFKLHDDPLPAPSNNG